MALGEWASKSAYGGLAVTSAPPKQGAKVQITLGVEGDAAAAAAADAEVNEVADAKDGRQHSWRVWRGRR